MISLLFVIIPAVLLPVCIWKHKDAENRTVPVLLMLYALLKKVWAADSLYPFSVDILKNLPLYSGFSLIIAAVFFMICFYLVVSALILLIAAAFRAAFPKKSFCIPGSSATIEDVVRKHRYVLLALLLVAVILSPFLFVLLQHQTSLIRLIRYDGSPLAGWMHRGFVDIGLPMRQLVSFIIFYFMPVTIIDILLFRCYDSSKAGRPPEIPVTLLRIRRFALPVFITLAAATLRMQTDTSCGFQPFSNDSYSQFPQFTIVNLLIALFLILLFSLLTGSFGAGIFITGILLTVLSLVNHYTLLWHGTFFRPEEILNLKSAMNVIRQYRLQVFGAPVHLLACFAAVAVIAYITQKETYPCRKKNGFLTGGTLLLLLIAGCLFCLPMIRQSVNLWNLQSLYAENGMLFSTVRMTYGSTLPRVHMPNEYNASAMQSDAYRQFATEGIVSPEDYPDIILILNETWFDMDFVEDTHADTDFMKHYHALGSDETANALTGYALVPGTGGLTNASEYELLTSNSMHLLTTDTPFNVLSFQHAHSVVDYMEQLGYATLAAHPATSANYRRGSVWEQLGFDEQFFQDDFDSLQFFGNRTQFATDASVFEEFTSFYEAMPADRPRFCYLLTIQNHGEWNHNTAELNHVKSGERFAYDETVTEQIDEFLTCTSLTDDMLGQMTDYFRDCGRNVVFCMVGDHAPSFITGVRSTKHDEKDLPVAYRSTPYVIWSNTDLTFPRSVADMPRGTVLDLCNLTPVTLQAAGLPLSPYYGLLTALPSETPCFTRVEQPENAPLLKSYFEMEYNNIGAGTTNRNDTLFLPNAH